MRKFYIKKGVPEYALRRLFYDFSISRYGKKLLFTTNVNNL